MKIGVFDSGVGGLSVANAILKQVPDVQIALKEDREHLPYGTKPIEDIYGYVKPIFQQFVDEDCEIIVVACNTVTTNLISQLRQDFKVPMVGMEPMVKPAAEKTKSKIIAVCATPRTLSSDRYRWLKDQYAQGIEVLEPDCSGWALMIESEQVDREKIKNTIDEVCGRGADEIVLGCTHYHWIEEIIKEIAQGRAEVLQPEVPVIEQLKRIIGEIA
jgi:glutamate racemase